VEALSEIKLVTKGEFARLINVSAPRISQLISEGKLADCLVGEGREARIDADKAREKLKLRLDTSQRLGNGGKTELGSSPSAPTGEGDVLDLAFKRAKLEKAEAENRESRERESARRGLYVLASDAKAEASKMTTTILQRIEGGLAGMAQEIAAEHKLPARDVVHVIRKKFRDIRAQIARELAQEAGALPQEIEAGD
jgi:hypothetical protein